MRKHIELVHYNYLYVLLHKTKQLKMFFKMKFLYYHIS